jgi:hypothetical protein
MDRFSLTAIVAIVCIPTLAVLADIQKEDSNTQIIPLNEIWGYNLPDTKDVSGIQFPKEKEGVGQTFAYLARERSTNIELIRRALAIKPPSEQAMAGFVLPRQPDSLILRGIYSQLNRKPGPNKRDWQEGEYTLVFFAHSSSYYARLKKVEREGNKITVHYQFEPHMTPEATVHFALIPLGELSAGEYHVDFQQMPLAPKYREIGFEPVHPDAAELVCRDFVFTVVGTSKEEPPIEGAAVVPLGDIWSYGMGEPRNYRKATGLIDRPTIDAMRTVIDKRSYAGQKAGPAFVVTGRGPEVLDKMLAIFTNQSEIDHSFPVRVDINLVFYTLRSGAHYIRIERIEVIGERIVVSYRPMLHSTADTSFHFAVVPLGKLPAGSYIVAFKQLPILDTSNNSAPFQDLSGLVCDGFSFRVE